MGMMAGIGGAVGGLAGLFGGGANNVQMPPQFIMPQMGQAAGNAMAGIGNLWNPSNLAMGTLGQAGQTFGNLYNNPYAGGFQQGAGVASGMGQNAALNTYGLGGQIQGLGMGMAGMGQSMIPGAQAVLNMGLDPQSQLYNYAQNQNTQQSQANAAAAGLANTPYGVGLANQSNQLFNMNWENQQLGRATQGLNAYGTALGQAGGLMSGGANVAAGGAGLQSAAPGQYLGASSMPYSVYGQIGQGQNQAIGSYLGNITGAMSPQEQQISQYLGYLGVGNQANSVANQNAALQLQQQQQNFNQQMMLGGMLGGSLYGLGNSMGFGGSGGSFLGNMMGFGGGMGGTYVNGMQVPAGSISYTPLQQSILAGYG